MAIFTIEKNLYFLCLPIWAFLYICRNNKQTGHDESCPVCLFCPLGFAHLFHFVEFFCGKAGLGDHITAVLRE